MNPETKKQVLAHLRSALLVLGAGVGMALAGMHPAAAAGAAGIAVASVDGSTRWRAGRRGLQSRSSAESCVANRST